MIIKSNTSDRRCTQCNSPLIFVREETSIPSGSKFPQTTSIYICSNESCQQEKDKQTAKRIKLQEDKDSLTQKKLQDKQKEKELQSKITRE